MLSVSFEGLLCFSTHRKNRKDSIKTVYRSQVELLGRALVTETGVPKMDCYSQKSIIIKSLLFPAFLVVSSCKGDHTNSPVSSMVAAGDSDHTKIRVENIFSVSSAGNPVVYD